MKKVLFVFSVIVMLFVASCQSSSVKEVSSDSEFAEAGVPEVWIPALQKM
jgi:hypothetical protein